ncbi:MAG: hypothetical protein COB26_12275 [Piscirickettsiaceae bacterium]|nr:MAG: hypothetical protein COB26_12275 [Piscirickettsiaceae bacterium]
MYRKAVSFLVSFAVFTAIFLPQSVFAIEQPAVAIKEPKVGEKISKYTVKHLNLELLWTEMESSFRNTRKFRVLSRDLSITPQSWR